MIAIELQDLQVGKKYYIHQVKDEDTHAPISRKYKAVCTTNYSNGGWFEFLFERVQGIHTEDLEYIDISLEQDRWGIYNIYLCESDEIIERVTTNAVLQSITRDQYFKFY